MQTPSGSAPGYTVKPLLCDHSKIDKTKVLKTGGRSVQVKSIAECSPALSDYQS